MSDCIGMKINQIMPGIISENHHIFIEKFLKSGKNAMISFKRELFLKKKNGYIIPVNTFLSANHSSLDSMILMVEPLETPLLF